MKGSSLSRVLLLAATALSAGLSADALAQDAPADTAGVADIVVTASRREERMQDVPISITALSPETLANAGVSNTAQLAQVTPGLNLIRNGPNAQFTIRGVSSRGVYAGDESNIALYIDGVYQPTPFSGVFDLLAIDRIEVLRGPQGTLFGRNATAGLINVITPDPSLTETSGKVEVKYGNFNTISLRGHMTTPLSDTIAIDLAGNIYDDKGYVRNVLRGFRTGDRTTYSARGKLLFQPSDTFKAILTASFNHTDDASGVATTIFGRNSIAYNPANSIPAAQVSNTPWQTSANFEQSNRVRQQDVSLRTLTDLGSVSLETTTSYQRNKTRNLTDNDAGPVNNQNIITDQQEDIFTDEVRLLSQDNDRFQWTAGAFAFLAISRYNPINILFATAPVFTQFSRNRTRSWAVFAEGTYALTDALKLTVGGRYSWENREFSFTRPVGAGTPPLNAAGINDATFKKFTPRVSLQYVISPDANIYATYSKGTKSGLFNTTGGNNSLGGGLFGPPAPVLPETLDAYEFGFKTDPASWIRLNGSVYLYKYKDLQVTERNSLGTSTLANAARATNYGGELEMTLVPTRDLQFNLAATYTHTNLDSYPRAVIQAPIPLAGSPGTFIGNTNIVANLAGNELIRSPKLTLSAGVSYETEVAFGKVGFSGNVYYNDGFWHDFQQRLRQPSYVLLNAQAWVKLSDAWRFSIWGENLTNEAVTQNAIGTPTGDWVAYGPPRRYGAAASFEF